MFQEDSIPWRRPQWGEDPISLAQPTRHLYLRSDSKNSTITKEPMKTIITLSAITLLAALALTGCGQNSSSGSTDASATNSNMNPAGGAGTNMMSTNSMPAGKTP
jgi:hypothetical protein